MGTMIAHLLTGFIILMAGVAIVAAIIVGVAMGRK